MRIFHLSLATLLLALQASAGAIEISREARPGADLVSAELDVRARIPEVRAALETPCAVKQWLPRTREIRILEQQPQGRARIRMVTDFPWPWRDRVAELAFQRHYPQPDLLVIQMQALNSGTPEPGKVRVTESRARWEITATDTGVRIHYQQRFHPGGTVPQWLADRVAGTQLRHALENLRKLLERENTNEDHCRWHPGPDSSPSGRRRAQP